MRDIEVVNWQCGLEHFCVGDPFEHVVASAEVGYAKPAREIFEEACHRLAVSPDRVLHVGDSIEEDVAGARGAGMQAVLIRRQAEDAKPAGEAIRGLEGVLQVLELKGERLQDSGTGNRA